jgi:hypothetical protein
LADLILELSKLGADRRLRAAEPVCGARETAEFETGDEGAQDVHVEVGAMGHCSIPPMCIFRSFKFSEVLS